MTVLFTHTMKSNGSKLLAKELGIKRIGPKLDYVPQHGETVINWGASWDKVVGAMGQQAANRAEWINDPYFISKCHDKLEFFRALDDKPYLPWWSTDRQRAVQRMRDTGGVIVCRTVLNGSCGRGIVIAHTEDQLVDAPLYVGYVPKKEEYRIHVGYVGNTIEIIDKQRKARQHGVPNEDVNWEIRNHKNGFIYMRGGVEFPASVLDTAKTCLRDLQDIHFGAIDIVYDPYHNRPYVLEINTAPGLEGQTVKSYANYFREELKYG